MKLTIQNIIIGLGLIGLGYLIYRNYIKNKQNKPKSGGTATAPQSTPGTTPTTTVTAPQSTPGTTPTAAQPVNLDFNKILKFGSTGDEVKALQNYINLISSGFISYAQGTNKPLIIVDGIFGNGTLTALQERVGKTQTTLKELNIIDINGNTSTQSTANNSNLPPAETNENWYETGVFSYAFWNWF